MTGNPIVEEKGEDFKKEVLILLMDNLTKLQKINGDGWEAEFFTEAKAEKIQREKEALAKIVTDSDVKVLELIEAMWQIFDAEGTGILDKDTCFKLIAEIISNLDLSPKENIEQIYEASFGNFDKNGNGTIVRNDIILIFKELVNA